MLGKALAVALVALLALVPMALPAAPLPQGPLDNASAGRWLQPFDGEVPAVNMVLLRTGEVLYWSGVDGHAGPTIPFFVDDPAPALARVWDPASGEVRTPTPEDGGAGDMFCSGQTVLPDGRVLVVGGTNFVNIGEGSGWHVYGLDSARLYDPASATFQPAPDMAAWRWYPTAITLPDGDVLVASGISDLPDPSTHVTTLERFDVDQGRWRTLPEGASNLLPLYPRLFVVPSGPMKGDVFYTPVGCLYCPFGTNPGEAPWSLDQRLDLGTNTWERFGPALTGVRQHAGTVMLTLKPGDDYRAKLLTAGGTLQRTIVATSTVEMTDLSTMPPKHAIVAPMAHARWHLNTVLLPTGQVLAVGGGLLDSVMVHGTEDPGVLPAELYEPRNNTWTTLASMQVPRMYHSTAVLLPDARVLVGGHVPLPSIQALVPQVNERRLEVFEPPYLFRGARPVINEAPDAVAYGAAFQVDTPDAAAVGRAVLVKPGSTTHSMDGDQRAIELRIAGRTAGSLDLVAPPDGDVAPPGHYMLFLLADRGQGEVPSVAAFVRLG
jgi:hypothetical protein